MSFLYWLQSIRTPAVDGIMSLVTRLGEETALMVVGMIILWCVSKKWGYRFFLVGLVGNTMNQLLKAIFLIPRPWVLDPEFPIVESAREAATGYSFPSGHTQTAAGLFGTLAMLLQKSWATALCIAMALPAGFSVHTPLDVGVSLATGLIIVGAEPGDGQDRIQPQSDARSAAGCAGLCPHPCAVRKLCPPAGGQQPGI